MDHLVFGVPDLARGIEWVERWTGVRARFGGRHPGRGTHNALLSLGGRQYLEIIALDPEQAEAPGLLYPELKSLPEPRCIAWAVAVESVADVAERLRAANIEPVGPLEGSRVQADGRLLAWKTLRLIGPTVEGLPFFIEWQKGTPHPSRTSPSGCRLTSFEIEHTDPEGTRRILKSLGAEAAITPGLRVRLKARLQTPKGEVELS
jgi:Glyoxalase-like domain